MAGNVQTGVGFACECRALQGRITAEGVQAGTHVVCYCPDCRAAELYFGQPDPAPDPIAVFQIAPEHIEIDQGAEHLAVMQLGPKGVYRWYAKCCKSPLANTLQTPKFPFASVIAKRVANPSNLGPVTSRSFVPKPGGKSSHERFASAVFGVLKRAAKSRFSGGWKKTPFFDGSTGEPVSKPTLISKSERDALYP